jgi:hypothetical protein
MDSPEGILVNKNLKLSMMGDTLDIPQRPPVFEILSHVLKIPTFLNI